MLTLWGRANSSNVMKVIWLLEELRIPYRRTDVGGPFGCLQTPEYRARNPFGVIPTLEDGGHIVFESNAILRHVARLHETPFWPADPYGRARVDMWMDAQQTTLSRPMGVLFQNLVRHPPAERDHDAIREATMAANRAWGVLNGALARIDYIEGQISLADFAWGVHVHRWFSLPLYREDMPQLRAWYERLLERPAYAATCAGPLS